ncbi:MAG: universal stress protein [Algoriphagus sp.]|nr:universal stress protein [Algoriphagus sp.]
MIHILVPFDFSKEATYALGFATKLSTTYVNLHISLVHVVEYPLNATVGTLGGGLDLLSDYQSQVFFQELIEQRKKDLARISDQFSSPRYTMDALIQVGNMFREISSVIAEKKPDLIVMGSSGTSGWEEFWIGSNAEKIVRHATCPVLTIKGETDPNQLKKVVFASNFQELDSLVASRIKNMQQIFDAVFYFVFVNTPGDFKTSREASSLLEKFIHEFKFQDIPTQIYNSLSEEAGILEFADDIEADLIAMTTHGRTGILHLLTGSIAEDVVNHSKRPVWTLKTPSLKA